MATLFVFKINRSARLLAAAILSVTFSMPVAGQEVGPYDLGGASKPRPQRSLKQDDHYKRVHQTSLRMILKCEYAKPKSYLNDFLANNPGDAETLYMLGLLETKLGKRAAAEAFFKTAIDAGLPPGRLIAGPRDVLRPMHESELFRDTFKQFETKLVHGPLIGNVTDNSAEFWFRTAKASNIRVALLAFDKGGLKMGEGQTKAKDDFTGVVTVKGLRPNMKYTYSVLIDGKPVDLEQPHVLKTFANSKKPAKFKIAFGGGAGYVPDNERMWKTIQDCRPDALLLLGDNVYIDDPESKIMQQYTYHRRQSRPEWKSLTAQTPVFTIWDDHDFGTDDSWGGADIEVPFWKRDVFTIFRQNWANPDYGGGDDQPGCWYSFSVGDVDFLMLDCRYYRTNPKQQPRTMLGSTQKVWLKKELTASKATFKVICSSVPWDFRTKGDSKDTWNGFKEEHEEILGWIDSEKIDGVVLMSADRHRSDAWKLKRPNGYDLYEFNSSRLTNQHVHPRMEKKGAIFSFNKPQSFGLVTFDTTADDPWVKYQVVDIDGKRPHELTVKLSQLSFDKSGER